MRKLVLFLLLAMSVSLGAQTPYLVKDINTTYSNDTNSSRPTGFVTYRNRVYFTATTEAAGTELWSSNGLSGGTSIVADVIPGPASSNPSALKVIDDVLLFNAGTVDHGIELWATDGTAAGTRRLIDINPGPSSSQPFNKTVYGNRMLFSADDGTNGRELWATDGTAAGTRLVKDINPGPASSSPAALVPFGGSVYFVAANALWKTDGTEAGTVKVTTVIARNFAVAGGRLFFEGFTSETGWELWVSDGSETGTRMVTEILPGPRGALTTNYSALGMTPFGDRVLFAATDEVHGREMWISDGTAAGTRMVRDFVPGAVGRWDHSFAYFTAFAGRVYFFATDAAHGQELWVTDGTDAGTALFLDVKPGPASSILFALQVSGGKLFFADADGRFGERLWVSDGTAAGTRVLRTGVGFENGNSAADGKLYFGGSTALHGIEPWVTDGTTAGTRMLANIEADGAPSSFPHMLTATSDLLFFYATEGILASTNIAEASLWRSDGTAAGTFKLRESGQHPSPLTVAGPYVFFTENVDRVIHYVSDGTVDGTKPDDEFMERFGGERAESFFPLGENVLAVVGDRGYDTSLWVTTPVANAPATRLSGSIEPYGFVEVAGHAVFYARTADSIHDRALWTTDGTPEGTYAIVPDLESSYSGVSPLVHAAGTIYFVKVDDENKSELWKSDGTINGTTAVKELPASVRGEAIVAAGRKVFFIAGNELWVSDGTEAGTVELMEFEQFSVPERLHAVGNRIVFEQDLQGLYELWGSDGTKAGTRLLQKTGQFSSLPSIEGIVYFAGVDDAHGRELWTTDGTLEGTRLLVDLNPGPASSRPSELTKLGNTLYFNAYTEGVGGELWALPLTALRLSIDDARAVEGDSGSAVLRFEVSLAPAPQSRVTVQYATNDGTARAGEDYDAATGTLTFAPGETRKTIEVRARGDVASENSETFFVTLRNASGVRLAREEAAGIVDDDDQAADVGVAVVFGESGSLNHAVRVSNEGPSAATNIQVRVTAFPEYDRQRCTPCLVPQLAPNASEITANDYRSPPEQVYLSAIAGARQDDPRPSNNAAGWTMTGQRRMVMDAAYLTPGATATIFTSAFSNTGNAISSDPAVVAISTPATRVDQIISVGVTALKPGTARIGFAGRQDSLLVTVVAAGTSPRWPNPLKISVSPTFTRAERPVTVTITPAGQAPLTGAIPTGDVIITSGGKELARQPVTAGAPLSFPVYFTALGSNDIRVEYAGDANFLPQTFHQPVVVERGNVTLTADLEPVSGAPGTYSLTVEVAGSPVAAPTGLVLVLNGANEIARVSLQPAGGGKSRGQVMLNLPAPPTLTLQYTGDTLHAATFQQVRIVRRRAARP